jgi:hypothetical protein
LDRCVPPACRQGCYLIILSQEETPLYPGPHAALKSHASIAAGGFSKLFEVLPTFCCQQCVDDAIVAHPRGGKVASYWSSFKQDKQQAGRVKFPWASQVSIFDWCQFARIIVIKLRRGICTNFFSGDIMHVNIQFALGPAGILGPIFNVPFAIY